MKLPSASLLLSGVLVLASLIAPTASAQPSSQPAAWFQEHSAWGTAANVTPSTDGAALVPVSAGEAARILYTKATPPGLPHLRSKAYIGDHVLRIEYLLTAGARASLFLHGRYPVQLEGPAAGTISGIKSDGTDPAAPTVRPALTPANSQPGVWQTLEASVRGIRLNEAHNKTDNTLLLEVKINGHVVQQNTIVPNWCDGAENGWEDPAGLTTIDVHAGGMAIRDFSFRRADFEAVALPKASGGETNAAKLIDYVKRGEETFRGLGCVECHATQRDDTSQKTGPNLFGLFTAEPRDRQIVAGGEGHRFTIKTDRTYLKNSIRTPFDELAIAEHGPTTGTAYLPAMPPFLPEVLPDAQIDALYAYLSTLNEPAQQGPVVKLVPETGLENYDPMTDRLQLLVDRTVRIQRGPMEGTSGRAIHVGLPNGINYTFDPRVLAITQLWQGGFLDMSGEFLNRGGGGLRRGYQSKVIDLGPTGTLLAPLNAKGEPIDLSFKDPIFRDAAAVRASLYNKRDLPELIEQADAQFLGYDRDSTNPNSAPEFRYLLGRNLVAVHAEMSANGDVRLIVQGEMLTPQSFAINPAITGNLACSVGEIHDGRWILPIGKVHDAELHGHLAFAPTAWHPDPSSFDNRTQPLVIEPAKANLPRGYVIESYHSPKDNYGRELLFEPLGMDLAPDGTIVVSTRTAGIWRLVKGAWHQFAEGIFDSLGVQIADQHGLDLVVGQKAELTHLSGQADSATAFATIADGFSYNGNYHAYMHGPVRDTEGNYIFLLNLNDSSQAGDNEYRAGGKYMGTGGGYRGWAFRVTKGGEVEPYADGLRSPASLGRAPDGRMWYADNQGEYVGTSKLFLLKKGAFYGHPAGLVDRPGMTPDSPEIAWEKVADSREKPVVLFPQGRLANSPGNPAWDTTGNKFGPFAGQMFIGDQTQSTLMRVGTEIVDGREQGFAINFATALASGVMRPLFLPDGSLLLGQTGRGWQAKGGQISSLQHIMWNGKTIPAAIHSVSAATDGFALKFTVAVPAEITDAALATALAIKSWTYRDAPDYGSPELDERTEAVTNVSLGADRTTLHVTLARLDQPIVHPHQTARVYQLTLDGKTLWHEAGPGFDAFYTLYQFPK